MSGVPASRPVLDDISVVIPTLGRETLVECLERIADGDAWPARVILVDQGANARVAEWVAGQTGRGLRVEHHRAPRRGRAAAVNRGLEGVRTRFVGITDDDCFVAPDWLQRLTEHLRRAPDTIVTGRVEPVGEEEVVALVTSRIPATYLRPRLRHDSLSGGNMGAAMAVLEQIGPLDEDPCLATAEDCEYSYRALRRGVPIAYAPDVLVSHLGWRDLSQREATYRSYARSRAGFYGKYLRRGDWFIALRVGIQLLRSSRRWASGIITGDAERALNGRANVLGLVPGLVAGWRRGRSS
jgi:GT2 family glycosyltransferase